MMHMPWVIVVLVIFLVVLAGGFYVAVRAAGGREVRSDHPSGRPKPG